MSSDETPPEGLAGEPGTERVEESLVEYGIEDEPPLGRAAALGLQHYLTMVGANIAVPLILASAMGMPADATAQLVGTFFVVSGVATLAQTTLGNRYPIVQGASFALLAPALAIVGVMASQPNPPSWEVMLRQLQGAIIVAALAETVIGYVGLVGWLKKYISPVSIAPTIALIGLALFNAPQIIDVNAQMAGAQQNWYLLGLTVLLIVGCSQYLSTVSTAFRLYPVLIGIVAAWGVAAVLSVVGVIGPNAYGYVDLSQVTSAPALTVPSPFQWGTPLFTPAYIVGMFAGFLASIFESFGDYHAVARLSGTSAPSAKRINHGIGMEGLMSAFAGIMGTGNGSTSYSENVGAIGLTGVASRYVVQLGALFMLVVGFVGYVGGLVTTIPDPIVGGLFVAMFGQIVAVGLSNLKYVDLDSSRNIYVLGFSLFVGLAVPAYMGGVADASVLQAGFADVPVLGVLLGTEVVAQTVYVVGGTGMAVGGLTAFVLDNTIPGSREERGLDEWSALTEDEGAFESAWERLRQ